MAEKIQKKARKKMIYRSAITGKFVTRQNAEKNPQTTVAETVFRTDKKEKQ